MSVSDDDQIVKGVSDLIGRHRISLGRVILIEIGLPLDAAADRRPTAERYLQAGASEVWTIASDGTRTVYRAAGDDPFQWNGRAEAVASKIAVAEAARFLECSEDAVLMALRLGRLPGLKIGKPWIIPRQAFFVALNDLALSEAAKLREDFGKSVSSKFPSTMPPIMPRARGRPRRARSE